jgi:hypothetical protein
MSGGLHPHAHADSSLLQFSVELLSFTIAVMQLPFPALSSFLIHKSNLLKARVIIYSYNDHVRLLPPEPLVVMQPKFTRVEGADIVMKARQTSSWPFISAQRTRISGRVVGHPEVNERAFQLPDCRRTGRHRLPERVSLVKK